MSFWTDKDTREPLRQNKWFLRFSAPEGGVTENIVFALKDCKKPKYTVNVSEHKLLNHFFRYPGVLKWEPVDIKFVSARGSNNDGDVAYVFYNLLAKSGYVNPAAPQPISFINKHDSTNFFSGASMEIIQVDSNGKEIEVWILENPFISSVDFGGLSYGSDEFVEVSVSIQYDYGILVTIPEMEEPTVSDRSPKNIKKPLRDDVKKAENIPVFDKGKIPPLDKLQDKVINKWENQINAETREKAANIADANRKYIAEPQDFVQFKPTNILEGSKYLVNADPYSQTKKAIDELIKSGKISSEQAGALKNSLIVDIVNNNPVAALTAGQISANKINDRTEEDFDSPVRGITNSEQQARDAAAASQKPARPDFPERAAEAEEKLKEQQRVAEEKRADAAENMDDREFEEDGENYEEEDVDYPHEEGDDIEEEEVNDTPFSPEGQSGPVGETNVDFSSTRGASAPSGQGLGIGSLGGEKADTSQFSLSKTLNPETPPGTASPKTN